MSSWFLHCSMSPSPTWQVRESLTIRTSFFAMPRISGTGRARFSTLGNVEGYTSPAWLAVLVLLWPTGIAPPYLAVGLGAILGLTTIFLLAFRFENAGASSALVGAGFLASNIEFVYWSWSGMDTALFTLVTATVLTCERDIAPGRGHSRPGYCWHARPSRLEALWLAPLLAGWIVAARRNGGAVSLVDCCLLPRGGCRAPALGGDWPHGTWLPNTYTAKVAVPLGSRVEAGLLYILAAIAATPLLAILPMVWKHLTAVQRRDIALPLSVVGWWAVYVILVGGDHFPLFRFFVPVLGLCAVIVNRVSRALAAQSRAAVPIAVAAVLLETLIFTPYAGRAVGRREVREAAAWAMTGQWCAAHL